MSKHRKAKSREPLKSVRYLTTGAAGAAAASASILMALPPNALTALTAKPLAVELKSFDVPLSPATDPWWQDLNSIFGPAFAAPTSNTSNALWPLPHPPPTRWPLRSATLVA